jgi:hypothetical protein
MQGEASVEKVMVHHPICKERGQDGAHGETLILDCPALVCVVTSPQLMKFFLLGLVALAIVALVAVRLLRGRIPVDGETASPAPSGTATKVAEVDAFTITLDVDEKPSLFVLLAADGAINRMGRGTLDDPAGASSSAKPIRPSSRRFDRI